MPRKTLILPFSDYDPDRAIADREAIRRVIPQRFEMEQLTAIVYEDQERGICAGYKDVLPDEFWIKGHMPGRPLMPGVLMCEAAAQLCSYFWVKHDTLGTRLIGFGGLEDVRFREAVLPGARLVIVAALKKVRRNAMVVSDFQGFVRQSLVCEGTILGVPLPE